MTWYAPTVESVPASSLIFVVIVAIWAVYLLGTGPAGGSGCSGAFGRRVHRSPYASWKTAIPPSADLAEP